MTRTTRRFATTALTVGFLLFPLHSAFAQKIEQKKPPINLKKHTIDAIKTTPELRVVRVERVDGTESPAPGEILRTRVIIANGSKVSATVSVASVGPSASVNRSSYTGMIPAMGQGSVRLDIPIHTSLIRNDEFKTTVAIVRANAPRDGAWLDQLWKDGNRNDNALDFRRPVNVITYTVTATVRRIVVHDDGDSSGSGEWRGSFFIYAGDGRTFSPYDERTLSWHPHNAVLVIGSSDGRESLNTGDVLERNATVRLRGVAAGKHVLAFLSIGEDDSPFWGIEHTGSSIYLTPRQWQSGGSYRTERRPPSHTKRGNYLEGSNMTVYFDIFARPESLN